MVNNNLIVVTFVNPYDDVIIICIYHLWNESQKLYLIVNNHVTKVIVENHACLFFYSYQYGNLNQLVVN